MIKLCGLIPFYLEFNILPIYGKKKYMIQLKKKKMTLEISKSTKN